MAPFREKASSVYETALRCATPSTFEAPSTFEEAAALSTPAAAGRAEWRVCRNMTLILTPRQPYVD
ncbi:hypothetical protein [Streptomyces marispadix]|uniref:Uncharacterized protein n=1 Tax=Streptomyces marispadix TaxID=2922868 RepID=A0ABS9SRR4_9ACTN|nr:hypothetical protein [Streptomyces marispadix]MCH6158970.1 hypothetical protein [Streptomyces marispadix]